MRSFNSSGQALVEYLFVLLFIIGISVKMIQGFSGFARDSFGNLAHVLTINLMTGTCKTQCFFSGYKNGPKE
jgi:hypothetical protein